MNPENFVSLIGKLIELLESLLNVRWFTFYSGEMKARRSNKIPWNFPGAFRRCTFKRKRNYSNKCLGFQGLCAVQFLHTIEKKVQF